MYTIRTATLRWEERVFGLRRKSAVSGMPHQQDEERKCAVPLLSHLQYDEKVVQCGEKVYSFRRVHLK